mgnify:FL=1
MVVMRRGGVVAGEDGESGSEDMQISGTRYGVNGYPEEFPHLLCSGV